MTRPVAALIAAAVSLASAAAASAQIRIVRETPRAGSWEVSGGFTWSGGFDGGTRAAELTRNAEQSGGFNLFNSSSEMRGAPGGRATLGVYVSSAIAVEAGLRVSRPRLTVRLTDDVENAAAVSAEETLTRYVITGSVVVHLMRLTSGRRAVPFIAAGAGHIRDLHEGSELLETGTEYHALGGLKYWFSSPRRKFGLRADAGVSISDGGFELNDNSRVLPVASASLVYLF